MLYSSSTSCSLVKLLDLQKKQDNRDAILIQNIYIPPNTSPFSGSKFTIYIVTLSQFNNGYLRNELNFF